MKRTTDKDFSIGIDTGIQGNALVAVEKEDGKYHKIIHTDVQILNLPYNNEKTQSTRSIYSQQKRERNSSKRKKKRLAEVESYCRYVFGKTEVSSNDIPSLRSKGLTEKLELNELVMVIKSMNAHRGYYDYTKGISNVERFERELNGDIEFSDEVESKLTQSKTKKQTKKKNHEPKINGTTDVIKSSTLSTIKEQFGTYGNYLHQIRAKIGSHIPTKGWKYEHALEIHKNGFPVCEMTGFEFTKYELKQILNKQKEFHHQITDVVIEEFLALFEERKPLKSAKRNLFCPIHGHFESGFYKGNKTASLLSPLVQEFMIWQVLNNFLVYEKDSEEGIPLEHNIKERCVNMYLTGSSLKMSQVLKAANLNRSEVSTNFDQFDEAKKEYKNNELLKNPIAACFGTTNLKELFKVAQKKEINRDVFISHLLRLNGEKSIYNYLKEQGCNLDIAANVAERLTKSLSIGYAAFSKRAINNILTHLKTGLTLHYAIIKAYGKTLEEIVESHSKNLGHDGVIHTTPNTNNPLVKNGLKKLRTMINKVTQELGGADAIRVEYAREMSSREKTKKAIEQNEKNKTINDKAIRLLEKEGINDPKPSEILRTKLWMESNGRILYPKNASLSFEKIELKKVLYGKDIEIEHIIPYSLTHNNSFNNKLLCYRSVNQEKGDLTYFEYYSKKLDEQTMEKLFKTNEIKALPKNKIDLMKLTKVQAKKQRKSKRGLQATSEISRNIRNMLISAFSEENVDVVNTGQLTSALRQLLNVNELLGNSSKNRNDLRHHFIDAVMIAMITPKVKYILNDYISDKRRNKIKHKDKWIKQLSNHINVNAIKKSLKIELDKMEVTHQAKVKPNGNFEKDTIYFPAEKVPFSVGKTQFHVLNKLPLTNIKTEQDLNDLSYDGKVYFTRRKTNQDTYNEIKQKINNKNGIFTVGEMLNIVNTDSTTGFLFEKHLLGYLIKRKNKHIKSFSDFKSVTLNTRYFNKVSYSGSADTFMLYKNPKNKQVLGIKRIEGNFALTIFKDEISLVRNIDSFKLSHNDFDKIYYQQSKVRDKEGKAYRIVSIEKDSVKILPINRSGKSKDAKKIRWNKFVNNYI